MALSRAPANLRPCMKLKPGRSVLDCSGAIHRKWIDRAVDHRLKVVVYRRNFRAEDLAQLPATDSVQPVSGELYDVLSKTKDGVSLLIDDLGSLHFHEEPLELLRRYYDALAWDGEAWLRFPKSFWVFLEDQHRVTLAEYIAMKFPTLAKSVRPQELDPTLELETGGEWLLLKKDRSFPKIFFHLLPRTTGGTSSPSGSPHAPYLEFLERPVLTKAA